MISLILPLAKINMCQTVRQQYPTTWSNWLKLGSQPCFPSFAKRGSWYPPSKEFSSSLLSNALPFLEQRGAEWPDSFSTLMTSPTCPREPREIRSGEGKIPHQPPELPYESSYCSQSTSRNPSPVVPSCSLAGRNRNVSHSLRTHTNFVLLLTRLEMTHFAFWSFPLKTTPNLPIPAPMVEKCEEQDEKKPNSDGRPFFQQLNKCSEFPLSLKFFRLGEL